MYKTKKQRERELEKLEESILKPKMEVEKREQYNTRPLKIFTEEELNDFGLTKHEIPVRYSDLITIREYIGKRLELSDDVLQMLTLKISLDYDGFGYEDLTFKCHFDGNIICIISVTCHRYTIGARIESIYNKDIQNLLETIGREYRQINKYYDENDEE